jgi:hypothetical protein
MLAPAVNARETAAWETPAKRATSWAEGGEVRLDILAIEPCAFVTE